MFNPVNKLIATLPLQLLVRRIRASNSPKPVWLNPDNISIDKALRLDLLKDLYQSDVYNYSVTTALNDRSHGDLFKALNDMFKTKVLHTSVDIQEITGLNASSSPISERLSIQEFVEKDCCHLSEVSERSFQANYDHKPIEIIHDPETNDHLVMYGWSPLLYLSNGNGSHHFAAMRYIASRLNKLVPINALLELTYLDDDAVQHFNKNYKCYLFCKDNEDQLKGMTELNDLPSLFFFNGRYLPYNTGLLMFHKKDWNLFGFEEKALSSVVTDFNAELEKFCFYQQTNKQFQELLSR